MSEVLRPFYVMAKPVCGVCNLDCAYCYYTDKMRELYPGQDRFLMDRQTLETYVRQYLALMPVQANFGWQGGEPLLAGLGFYRQAVEFQKQCSTGVSPVSVGGVSPAMPSAKPATGGTPVLRIANAIQTNGTLLDDAWCEFFAQYRFLVGLSLDGPPAWHDAFRRDRAGQASFARAWAGLELLRKHQVEFNVLVTLNRRNAPHAGDIYRYFVNRGLRWLQFIPVLEKDAAGNVRDFSCTSRQFGRFMLEVFELWRSRHVGVVSERLIDSVLHTLVHGSATLCCHARRCANAYVLEWNGDLYACDHFVYRRWLLGNLNQTPLAQLVGSKRLEEFAALKTNLPAACRDCQYLPYCQGGCPKHHVPSAETGNDARVNHFCAGYKMFFERALPELKRLAEHLKNEASGTEAASGFRPQTSGDGILVVPEARSPRPEAFRQARSPRPEVASVPGRNDPCPCGSGRKFKHCCGRTPRA